MNKSPQTLRGSWSADSKRIFASKYSLERWKALDEIYKIYKLLHRSAFKNSARFRQTFSHCWSFIFKISLILRSFCANFTNFDERFPEFQQICWRRSKSPRFSVFLGFRNEFSEDGFRKVRNNFQKKFWTFWNRRPDGRSERLPQRCLKPRSRRRAGPPSRRSRTRPKTRMCLTPRRGVRRSRPSPRPRPRPRRWTSWTAARRWSPWSGVGLKFEAKKRTGWDLSSKFS